MDSTGQPVGEGSLTYINGDVFTGVFTSGVLGRAGVVRGGGEVASLTATWNQGFLTGRAKTEYMSGGWREGWYEHGVLHGFVRSFGVDGHLTEFGCYCRGVAVGPAWRGLLGGGYLVGRAGTITAFLYPDCRTALVGSWTEAGRLERAQLCRLVSSRSAQQPTHSCEHCTVPGGARPTSRAQYSLHPPAPPSATTRPRRW